MAKPPLHKVCGTSHWSTERCPDTKVGSVPTRTKKPAEPVKPKSEPRVKNAGKAAPARAGKDCPSPPEATSAPSQSTDGVALKSTKHPKGKPTRRRDLTKANLEATSIQIDALVMEQSVQHWKKRALAVEAIVAEGRKKASDRVKKFRAKAKA